jgi:hypothetical protein
MLFHVTMTHTVDNCPAYHNEKMPALLASLEKLDEVGKQLNVKAHELLWGAPEHVIFAVLEADNYGAVGRYLTSIALTQDFEITPVQNVSEFVVFAKEMMAQARNAPMPQK